MVQRAVALAFCSCTLLLAQEPRDLPRPKPVQEAKEQGEVKGVEAGDGGAEDVKAAGANGGVVGTPAEPVVGSRGLCRIEVSVRPGRLLPGQSGTAVVTMMLEGDAVMTAPATVNVQALGGALQFGSAVLSPPEPGRLAKFFRGQPVYDNWAVLELPVTMTTAAPLGTKQVAALDLSFDLVNGTTGQPIGRFAERASVSVEVGTVKDPQVRIPDLASQLPDGQAAQTPERQDRSKSATLAPEVSGDRRMDPDLQPSVHPVSRAEPQSAVEGILPDEPTGPVVGDDGGSNHLLLYLAGGALLLVLVLILRSKK